MRCSYDPSHTIKATARSDARFCSDACRAAHRRRLSLETIGLALVAVHGGHLATADALLSSLVARSRMATATSTRSRTS